MQNLYPLFERNRILKKELLWSLRDYSFSHIMLEYQEYGEGIIRGCGLRVTDGELTVLPGIVKHGDFIYLVMEEMTVAYEPEDRLEIIKFRMEKDSRSSDYIDYHIDLIRDTDPARRENEFEICRYKLRKGAKLRCDYTDFTDMRTEFDTVSFVEATWGGVGGQTLSPAVTGYFSEMVLELEGSLPEDIQFAYLCLNQPGAVSGRILNHYVTRRLGLAAKESRDHLELYQALRRILEEIGKNRKERGKNGGTKRKIMVDY